MGPVQQGQMHSGPMGNQVNIAMANQMNGSVNSPVANITVTGPGQMVNAMNQQVPSPMQGGMRPNQMNMAQMNQLAGQPKVSKDLLLNAYSKYITLAYRYYIQT